MQATLAGIAGALGRAGANLTIETPGRAPIRVGARPDAAHVILREPSALSALARGDVLALCEAYLMQEVDVEGDFQEVVKLVDAVSQRLGLRARLRALGLRFGRPPRSLRRASVAFHYGRPAGFFLPWFERWRSYSHGLYETPREAPEHAQERKLARAVEALALAPGARVLDVGCGWGPFVEYAGRRGIEVHAITLDAGQQRFVEALVREAELPCRVELADFFDLRTAVPYDAAVFMGSLEHLIGLRDVAARLRVLLRPGGRIWADFCAERSGQPVGAFLARHVWPGAAHYVDPGALVSALAREGFNVYELCDDTASYGYTCRDWADALERERKHLVERFGEAAFRTFQIYLRASQHAFERNTTQAYHLVAGLGARPNP